MGRRETYRTVGVAATKARPAEITSVPGVFRAGSARSGAKRDSGRLGVGVSPRSEGEVPKIAMRCYGRSILHVDGRMVSAASVRCSTFHPIPL